MLSITTHVGGECHLDHNARRSVPAHVNSKLSHQNYTYELDPDQVYQTLFHDALIAYNAGKRPCRRIHNIYQHLIKLYDEARAKDKAISPSCTKYRDKRKTPIKEMLIQFGNIHDTHQSRPNEKAALLEYAQTFHVRNPTLHLIGIFIHMDEQTTHLHLDFISRAENVEGLFQKLSFEQALIELGHKPNEHYKTPFESWQATERQYLKELAKKYGIETRDSIMTEKRNHLTKDNFIIREELKKADTLKRITSAIHARNINQLAQILRESPHFLIDITRAIRISQNKEKPIDIDKDEPMR